VIRQVLEAGRLSPSGGNEQPWLFGVLTDRDLIGRISEIARRQAWIAHAPLIIVLCTVGVDDARGGREIQCERYPAYAEQIRALDQDFYWALNQEEHQTKIAGTHMVLAALEHGLGSCWVSMFDVKQIAQLLCLPDHVLHAEMLVFGYPIEEKTVTGKKDLEELVFHNRYGV
jgi:nitroreductase